MLINVSKFFDFEAVDERCGFDEENYYDVLLVSKSTGEVITLTFNEQLFDELLKEMEKEYNGLKAHYEYISWAIKEKGYI